MSRQFSEVDSATTYGAAHCETCGWNSEEGDRSALSAARAHAFVTGHQVAFAQEGIIAPRAVVAALAPPRPWKQQETAAEKMAFICLLAACFFGAIGADRAASLLTAVTVAFCAVVVWQLFLIVPKWADRLTNQGAAFIFIIPGISWLLGWI